MPARIALTESVLNNVIGVIERDGESAVRVRDVCRAVGITAPSLYELFDSREALVVAAQAKRYSDSRLRVLEAFRAMFGVATNADDFAAATDVFVGAVLSSERAVLRAMRTNVVGAAVGRPALLKAVGDADHMFVEEVRRVLGAAQAAGWIRPDVEIGAAALWWTSSMDGRFHIETLPSGVAPADWDHVAWIATRAIWFGR